MKKMIFAVFAIMLVIGGCQLPTSVEEDYEEPIFPAFEAPMGTINLSSAYGTGSFYLGHPDLWGINAKNILSGPDDTAAEIYFSSSDPTASGGASFIVTFPTPYFMTTVYWKARAYRETSATYNTIDSIKYTSDGVNWVTLATLNLPPPGSNDNGTIYEASYTVNTTIKAIALNVSIYHRDNDSSIYASCYSLLGYGPEPAPSYLKGYKNGTVGLANDQDNVSDTYFYRNGNQRLSMASTSNLMASPYRVYNDGSTYAVLKPNGA